MKKSLILLIYSFGFFYPEYIQSQLLYNNGAPIYISTGAIVRSRGAVNNENSGSIQNFGNLTIDSTFTNDANASGDGIWFVSGNWINNFIFLQNRVLFSLKEIIKLLEVQVQLLFII